MEKKKTQENKRTTNAKKRLVNQMQEMGLCRARFGQTNLLLDMFDKVREIWIQAGY